jgi:hypothetical protein
MSSSAEKREFPVDRYRMAAGGEVPHLRRSSNIVTLARPDGRAYSMPALRASDVLNCNRIPYLITNAQRPGDI